MNGVTSLGYALCTGDKVGTEQVKTKLTSLVRSPTQFCECLSAKGGAWGAPIEAVDVRLDDGLWKNANLIEINSQVSTDRGSARGYAWRFWTMNWENPGTGEHRITSRATDVEGNVQPTPTDVFLASRRTYWEINGHITRRIAIQA